MISEQMWCTIAHNTKQCGFACVGFGDFVQLKPVGEDHIDFRYSWIDKYVCNDTICELNRAHRFNDSELLQDAYKWANGENNDFGKYNT
jgi:hypothetical protein